MKKDEGSILEARVGFADGVRFACILREHRAQPYVHSGQEGMDQGEERVGQARTGRPFRLCHLPRREQLGRQRGDECGPWHDAVDRGRLEGRDGTALSFGFQLGNQRRDRDWLPRQIERHAGASQQFQLPALGGELPLGLFQVEEEWFSREQTADPEQQDIPEALRGQRTAGEGA